MVAWIAKDWGFVSDRTRTVRWDHCGRNAHLLRSWSQDFDLVPEGVDVLRGSLELLHFMTECGRFLFGSLQLFLKLLHAFVVLWIIEEQKNYYQVNIS